jgi:predicted GIY-YIG superfamily endonuclease
MTEQRTTWLLYILECADGSWYTGITNNLPRRVLQHNEGRASRYTRARLPVHLVYSETCSDRSEALRREYAVKALARVQKEALIRSARDKPNRTAD